MSLTTAVVLPAQEPLPINPFRTMQRPAANAAANSNPVAAQSQNTEIPVNGFRTRLPTQDNSLRRVTADQTQVGETQPGQFQPRQAQPIVSEPVDLGEGEVVLRWRTSDKLSKPNSVPGSSQAGRAPTKRSQVKHSPASALPRAGRVVAAGYQDPTAPAAAQPPTAAQPSLPGSPLQDPFGDKAATGKATAPVLPTLPLGIAPNKAKQPPVAAPPAAKDPLSLPEVAPPPTLPTNPNMPIPNFPAPNASAPSNNVLPGNKALPGDTLPSDTLPGNIVPSDTLPGDTLPSEAANSEAANGEAANGEAANSEAANGEAAPSIPLPSDNATGNASQPTEPNRFPGSLLPAPMPSDREPAPLPLQAESPQVNPVPEVTAEDSSIQEPEVSASDRDDVLAMPPSSAPEGYTCDEIRGRLKQDTIDRIILDVSPRFGRGSRSTEATAELKEEFAANAPVRTWYDRSGREIAEGRLQDWRRNRAILDVNGEQVAIPVTDLSDNDVAYISESWGVPHLCGLSGEDWQHRQFSPLKMTWKSSELMHKPLYFEEVALERYGHTAGPILQPVLSTGHFFANIAVLPYKMGIHPMSECQYALGYYRPGNCAPWQIPAVPLSGRGALMQAGVVTGVAGLLP